MFIAVESTPNPRTRKFLPGARLTETPREFHPDTAGDTEMIESLFLVGGVQAVLVSDDAVSVTITDEHQWHVVTPRIEMIVSEHARAFAAHVFLDDLLTDDGDYDADDANVVTTIKELIETRIRPAVARDGGDIVFRSFRGGVLSLDMRGACSGCPSSTATLKHGIQNLMQYFVPEVTEVIAA